MGNDDLFPNFPEIKSTKDGALDYAALWMDRYLTLTIKIHPRILSRIRQIIF